VVALAIVGGCAGWITALVIGDTSGTAPAITWPVAALWALVAAVLFAAAWRTHDQLNRKNRYVEPLTAVRLLVFGKAAAVVTPLVGGFYLGIAVWRVTLGPAHVFDAPTLTQLGGVLALFAAAVAGLALQRACRLPPGDDDGAAPA